MTILGGSCESSVVALRGCGTRGRSWLRMTCCGRPYLSTGGSTQGTGGSESAAAEAASAKTRSGMRCLSWNHEEKRG